MRRFQNMDFFSKETYEYAFSQVPDNDRKRTGRLAFILVGFAFSSSGLTVGTKIGGAMEFYQAVIICLAANTLLFLMALLWGMLGYQSGHTITYLLRKMLGDKVSALLSSLIVVAMIIRMGMNGEILARLILSIFSGWFFPESVTTMLVVALLILGSVHGWRQLEVVNGVVVPLIGALTLYGVVWIWRMKGGLGFLLCYQSAYRMSLSAAIAMTVGNFALSATTMPDICRFAKSRRAVLTCASAYALALTMSNLCGILLVQATEANNLIYGIFLLNMVFPGFLWMVLSSYTTQNVNVYMGSLAMQNFVHGTEMGGNISHKLASYLIGGQAVILGVIGVYKHLEQITNVLVVLVMPLTGIAVAELLLGKKWRTVKEWAALLSWGVGTASGCAVWIWGETGMWSESAIVAGLCYGLLRNRMWAVKKKA